MGCYPQFEEYSSKASAPLIRRGPVAQARSSPALWILGQQHTQLF